MATVAFRVADKLDERIEKELMGYLSANQLNEAIVDRFKVNVINGKLVYNEVKGNTFKNGSLKETAARYAKKKLMQDQRRIKGLAYKW